MTYAVTSTELTDSECEFIKTLRDKGHAIVVFNVSELGRAEGCDLEDYLIQKGNLYLGEYNDCED